MFDRLADRRRAAGPGRTLVCATLQGALAAQAREREEAAGLSVGLVEHRLDLAPDGADTAPAFFTCDVPTLATLRPAWEGGGFLGSEEERRRRLERAVAGDATLVDVEVAAPWRAAFIEDLGPSTRHRVVLSAHDFRGVPADLEDRVRSMLAEPVAFAKYAVRVASMMDLVALAGLAARIADPRLVLVAMGPCGVAGRILAHRLRAPWTYGGDAVAPGQLPWRRLVEEFRVPSLSHATGVRALVGRPLAHSVSPAMHNAASAVRGDDAVYVPCEVEEFDDFLQWADAWDVDGASVTIPFKRAAASLATPADALVARLGAANTLRRGPGGWESLNTDLAGFLAPLAGHQLVERRAVVLGAGGGAAAAAAGLAALGARVTIRARRPEQAAELATRLGVACGEWPPPVGSWDLLVNATPVGTWPQTHASPVPARLLEGGGVVYDLVYHPATTRLLDDAASAGCVTIPGLPMLVAQAERQFTWWTGAAPPEGVMRAAAERALAEG